MNDNSKLRAGDTVQPNGRDERWVVAYADHASGRMSWIGWPEGTIDIADVVLVNACDDAAHERTVREVGDDRRRGDHRYGAARRLYPQFFRCPESVAHGAHACVLEAGHAPPCRWDYEDAAEAARNKALLSARGLASTFDPELERQARADLVRPSAVPRKDIVERLADVATTLEYGALGRIVIADAIVEIMNLRANQRVVYNAVEPVAGECDCEAWSDVWNHFHQQGCAWLNARAAAVAGGAADWSEPGQEKKET